jgi:predicted nucleic acid-binding protein
LKPFADTNVVIYALVPDDARKQSVAQQLLAGLRGPRPLISTQTLAECYHVLTRRKAWKPAAATKALRVLAELTVVVPSAETVLQGLELAARHQLSGWDALVVQAALQAGCDTLFTEDLQTGRRFGTLSVVNPFADAVQELSMRARRRA